MASTTLNGPPRGPAKISSSHESMVGWAASRWIRSRTWGGRANAKFRGPALGRLTKPFIHMPSQKITSVFGAAAPLVNSPV